MLRYVLHNLNNTSEIILKFLLNIHLYIAQLLRPERDKNQVLEIPTSAIIISVMYVIGLSTLKISPCSVCAKKKYMDLVRCVAEQTKIIPRSGSSKSFLLLGIGHLK